MHGHEGHAQVHDIVLAEHSYGSCSILIASYGSPLPQVSTHTHTLNCFTGQWPNYKHNIIPV